MLTKLSLVLAVCGTLMISSCNTMDGKETPTLSDDTAPTAIDHIVVEKKNKTMKVYHNQKLLKTYKVALGPNPTGHKCKEGDGKTPEGKYRICGKNSSSRFYRSLKISYPNNNDLTKAKKQQVKPGGDIMIHGLGRDFARLGKLHTLHDWTLGCIAVTNEEISEIFKAVEPGTEVEIKA